MLEQKKTLPKVLLFFRMPLYGVTIGLVLLEMTGIAKPVNYNKKAVYCVFISAAHQINSTLMQRVAWQIYGLSNISLCLCCIILIVNKLLKAVNLQLIYCINIGYINTYK